MSGASRGRRVGTAARWRRWGLGAALGVAVLPLSSCRRGAFPDYPANFREFAYVADAASDTVAVLDLVYMRQDRVLQVGKFPAGMAVNPLRNEVYVANAGAASVSVIDAENSRVAATIGVQDGPQGVEVAADGKRAYVANAGSNTVSVVDLDRRQVMAVEATGEGPARARLTPDNRFLVVSNRVAGSVSVYAVDAASTARPLVFRESFAGCPGATDIAIRPNDVNEPRSGEKAFVACSGGHQVMVVWLAATPDSWGGQVDSSLQSDHLLAMLDVGQTPTSLTLTPGGEVFSTNAGSDSISEISTWTNEVSGTYVVGSKPTRAIASADGASLWIANSGADSIALYAVDDGRLVTGLRTGPGPGAMAWSEEPNHAEPHLLLVADAGSGDVAAIRMQSRNGGPALFTLFPAGRKPGEMVVKAFAVK